MLLTKQQKFLLAALEKLGCAELRQLAALLQKTFAFSLIDNAVRVTGACVRQMQMGGLLQISEDDIVYVYDYVNSEMLNAIAVMLELCAEQPLPAEYRDHALTNSRNYKGMRECHIQPNWLLVYRIRQEILVLQLIRTGTRSDLF